MSSSASKVLILLDADVYIHFHKGDKLTVLKDLYGGRLVILDNVASELFAGKSTEVGSSLENMIRFGAIKELPFPKDIRILSEYAALSKTKGKGESACLAICRYNNHILASSNTIDIKKYCDTYSLAYLTTIDILCIAKLKGLLSEIECDDFVKKVTSSGSFLNCKCIADSLLIFDNAKLSY
jgi:predicted nucleic acid-binding protein